MEISETPLTEGNDPSWHEDAGTRKSSRALFAGRFAEVQRRRRPRRWISFSEIATHCAAVKAAAHADPEKWDAEFWNALATALMDGRFDERGRSMVLYLAPDDSTAGVREPVRLTAEWSRGLRDIHGDTIFREYVFAHCWLHYRVCLSWFRGSLSGQGIVPPRDWFGHTVSGKPTQVSPPRVKPPLPALPPHLEADIERWRQVFRSTGIGEDGMRQLLSPDTYIAKPGSLFEKLGPSSMPYVGPWRSLYEQLGPSSINPVPFIQNREDRQDGAPGKSAVPAVVTVQGNGQTRPVPDQPKTSEIMPMAQLSGTRRKSNGLDYRRHDAPLIVEMRAMIETGEARSPENAARAVVGRAAGGGAAESKVKRLALRYRETHPEQPVE